MHELINCKLTRLRGRLESKNNIWCLFRGPEEHRKRLRRIQRHLQRNNPILSVAGRASSHQRFELSVFACVSNASLTQTHRRQLQIEAAKSAALVHICSSRRTDREYKKSTERAALQTERIAAVGLLGSSVVESCQWIQGET